MAEGLEPIVAIYGMMEKFADGHALVLEEFGRYPTRNKSLGRPSTENEEKYIKSGLGWGLKKKIFQRRAPYGQFAPVI